MTLCCFLLSSYQNCLWVDIVLSFWNTSYEDLNLFPAAPLLFGAIVWLKTLQGEKKNLIQWFSFRKPGTQEFSLVFFLFNEVSLGSSLGTFLVDLYILFSLLFFLWVCFGFFLAARTEWLWKPKSPVIENAALSWGELLAVFSQVLFFSVKKYGDVMSILCVDGIMSGLIWKQPYIQITWCWTVFSEIRLWLS